MLSGIFFVELVVTVDDVPGGVVLSDRPHVVRVVLHQGDSLVDPERVLRMRCEVFPPSPLGRFHEGVHRDVNSVGQPSYLLGTDPEIGDSHERPF